MVVDVYGAWAEQGYNVFCLGNMQRPVLGINDTSLAGILLSIMFLGFMIHHVNACVTAVVNY
jgi:hypothetical protein